MRMSYIAPRALLQAFSDDWGGAAPVSSSSAAAAANGGDEGQEAPDVVRPGRFMATLHAMRAELEAGKGGAPDTPSQAAILSRLGSIQMEAMAVLDSIQRGGRAM